MKILFILFFILLSNCSNSENNKVLYKEVNNNCVIDTSITYEIYSVDIEPTFPGGNDSLNSFIQNNLSFKNYQFSYTGIICFCFYINIDGNAYGLYIPGKTENLMFYDTFNELIKKMPKWTPGKIGKTKVKTLLCLPYYMRLR